MEVVSIGLNNLAWNTILFNLNSLNMDLIHPSIISYCTELQPFFTAKFPKVWHEFSGDAPLGGKINIQNQLGRS